MDEKLENMLRSIIAKQMAHQFLIDWFINQALMKFPRDMRLRIAEALLDASTQTDFASGMTKDDDFAAERWADIIVQMQQEVDQTVGRALLKTAEIEDGRLQRLGEQSLGDQEEG